MARKVHFAKGTKYTARKSKIMPAGNLARRVRRLEMSKELKYCETDINSAGVGTTPVIAYVSDIDQGDTHTTRTGDNVIVKSVQLNGVITNTASTGDVIRVVLVRDKENTGADPAWGDVFQSSGAVFAMKDWLNKSRFSIVSDGMYSLNNTGKAPIAFKKYIKIRKMFKTRYSGSGGAGTADARENAYFVLIQGFDNTNKSAIQMTARLVFDDA